MRTEFVEMEMLCQGRVIVNLGNKNDPNDNATIAVPMMWVTLAEINDMKKQTVDNVVKQYGCKEEETETILLVAKTLSNDYIYVGMFTLNQDRTFLGLHDLVETPKLTNVQLREIK